ncbi:MAG: amidophosphoribosyltransferase [Kiritimatiellaeota bacterium]|nr:amidophosphoribosyltransferase [Kiritimatiellota bacterium]
MKEHLFADHPREHCGLFSVFGVPGAAQLIYTGLFALQHRGQEGAGIATSAGAKVHSTKGEGLLNEVFTVRPPTALPGHLGIGHVRYSTTGSSRPQNVQPIVCECSDGLWALAHNGNLTNAKRLRHIYQDSGAIFQTSTDSEILMHIIADPQYRTRTRRVERALSELEGAFAFLIMTKHSVMATRDRFGFRPLSIGRLGQGYVFASETCALDQVGATFERDVLPGELVVVDEKGIRSSTFCEPVAGPLGQCIFEHVYFARPDSIVFGQNVHETRIKLGRQLAREHPVAADLVMPVPDSGNEAALGFSQASGIPMDYGFIRNHYIGRTFIMPEMAQRQDSIDLKLAIVPGVVRDQRVVVVDDSIVRGSTCKRRIAALRRAGAKEVHMRVSCPPVRHPCFFGIDFPSSGELIAAGHSVPEIRDYIQADSLAYLSLEGLLGAFEQPGDFCTGCYSGKYPVAVTEEHSKQDLEKT